MEFPPQARQDLRKLVTKLLELGYEPVSFQAGPMHSYVAEFDGPRRLTIVCDRGQLFVDGDQAELEAKGLWRAFDDRTEFTDRVLSFLESR